MSIAETPPPAPTEEVTTFAWHFLPANGYLRYSDQPAPSVGEALTVDPDRLALCAYGLHASERAIDALGYAPPECVATRVRLGGRILRGDDKLCASERTILARLTPEQTDAVLRSFARACALDVLHLWDAPPVVREYLETGNESKRAAAWDAARDAARDVQNERLEGMLRDAMGGVG